MPSLSIATYTTRLQMVRPVTVKFNVSLAKLDGSVISAPLE